MENSTHIDTTEKQTRGLTLAVKNLPRVDNFCNPYSGNIAKNQFIIQKGNIEIFQSYRSIIAVKNSDGKIYLDEKFQDYSKTTVKFLGWFLNSNSKEIRKSIANKEYLLTNLNTL